MPNEKMYILSIKWVTKNPKKPWESVEYQNKLLLQDYVLRLRSMRFKGTSYVYSNFIEKSNQSFVHMHETYKRYWTMWSEKFKCDPNFE
jgi:hypothetical protein